jgi:hypothetical protein
MSSTEETAAGSEDHRAGVKDSTKYLTELDLAKIVAQKYAKNQSGENHSAIVKEEFRNVYKVWSAFVKFLRAQTSQGKQKLVDTTFIGYLYKKDDEPVNSANLELLIS